MLSPLEQPIDVIIQECTKPIDVIAQECTKPIYVIIQECTKTMNVIIQKCTVLLITIQFLYNLEQLIILKCAVFMFQNLS